VCWLGHESLQAQCLKLVTQLWSHGVAADLVYENQELDSLEDIQVVHTTCWLLHVVPFSWREKNLYRCRMGMGRNVLYFCDGLHEKPTKIFTFWQISRAVLCIRAMERNSLQCNGLRVKICTKIVLCPTNW
jgi:hypothetical protein